MGLTITEKILAAHAGKDVVRPGQFVTCKVDLAMGNDITAPIAIRQLAHYGIERLWDKNRVCLIPSHFVPNKDVPSAQQAREMRQFARRHGVAFYFERGRAGVDHVLLPEQGLVGPGDLVIGADSHTCTYGALGCFSTGVGSTELAAVMATGEIWLRVPETMLFEFRGLPKDPWVGGKDLILRVIKEIGFDGATYRAMEFRGEAISRLPLEGRLTMTNMAIEAGGKSGIIEPDQITEQYCRGRCKRPYTFYYSDRDANYRDELVSEIAVADLPPQVARPHCPDNVVPVGECAGVSVDQVFIGSCTNGRLSDLKVAAQVMQGRRLAAGVRGIVIPATPAVFLEALRLGYLEVFKVAGCDIADSTCGPCLGGHSGVLAAGEVCVATSNRNFPGRMGHREAQVYLASPAVAAAAAVTGRIVHPGEVADPPPSPWADALSNR